MNGLNIKQSIKVKFLPATDYKPSRLKATSCGGDSLTESKQYIVEGDEYQALKLAMKLAKSLGWSSTPVSFGRLDRGDVLVITFSSIDEELIANFEEALSNGY